MFEARGARNRRISTRVRAWVTPASGPVAPLRILVAVRAIAPVAANPPNRGTARLAMP
ncbi:hypothetical protein D3C80_1957530 [compost metagenome]